MNMEFIPYQYFMSFNDDAWKNVRYIIPGNVSISKEYGLGEVEKWTNIKKLYPDDDQFLKLGLKMFALELWNKKKPMTLTWCGKKGGVKIHISIAAIHCPAGVVLKTTSEVWDYFFPYSMDLILEQKRRSDYEYNLIRR